MNTQAKSENLLHVQHRRPRRIYAIIILALCLVVWFAGSLPLIFSAQQSTLLKRQNAKASPYISKAEQASVANRTGKVSTATAVIDPTLTPTPTPEPIYPFPVYLDQQISLLQAKDRFFSGGNPNLPEVALTFDDGPNPLYTTQILTILQDYQIHASFFVIGRQAQVYPDLIKQEYNNGNLVGNHTWSHPNLPFLSTPSIQWQFITTSNVIAHILGVRPIYFRPPYGNINSSVLSVANSFGDTTVIWNVDPRDWSQPGVATIVTRVLYQVRNGSIILMHDGGGNRSQTVAALPLILDALLKRCFRLVTIPQLLKDTHNNGQTNPQKAPPIPFRVS